MFLIIYSVTLFMFMLVSLTFFSTKEKNNVAWNALKMLSLFFWVLSIYEIILLKKTNINTMDFISIGICFISLVLYVWTYITVRNKKFGLAFNKECADQLVTAGPFSYVRHPFYTSYLLCYFSYFIYDISSFSSFSFLCFLFIYYKASVEEEDVILESSMADQYKVYKKSTGRFLPFIL